MKHRLRVTCAVFLSLLLGACQPSAPAPADNPAQLTPVNICVAAISPSMVSIWYAYEHELFQKYGIEPDITHVAGGGNLSSALLAGRVDMCVDTTRASISSALAGEDIVIVATLYERQLFNLVARSDIQTPQDLIGRGVAAGNPGGIKESAARRTLIYLGLEPDTQVDLVSFRDNDEPVMAAAVESGTVAGAVLAPPLLTRYRAMGLHVLFDMSEMDLRYHRLGVSTTRSFIASNRAAALGVLKAVTEAGFLMKHDPEGTQAALAKYLSLDPTADSEDLAAAYDIFVLRYLLSPPQLSEAVLAQGLLFEAAAMPEAVSLTPAQISDVSLLKELTDNGFIQSLSR